MSSGTSTRAPLRLGKYVVLGHIAAGGMAAVYRARDEETGREVALKVLSSDHAESPVRVRRFGREAKALHKLDHPNIVAVYDSGFANDTYFIAMEYVDGPDLCTHVEAHRQLPAAEVVDILTQAARALSHAYFQGIVHRDVKPSNLLLRRIGDRLHVKLTDFGLALDWTSHDESRLTRQGTTIGTVDYMAPEQARGTQLVDIRSDLYSLGCTAYYMLTGRPPFPDGATPEKLYKHVHVTPPDPRDWNPKAPDGLIEVLGRLLQKRPEDRYQTPAELLVALEKLQTSLTPALSTSVERLESQAKTRPGSSDTVRETPAKKPRPTLPVEAPVVRRPPPIPDVQPGWSKIGEVVTNGLVYLSDPRVLVAALGVVLAIFIGFLLLFWPK